MTPEIALDVGTTRSPGPSTDDRTPHVRKRHGDHLVIRAAIRDSRNLMYSLRCPAYTSHPTRWPGSRLTRCQRGAKLPPGIRLPVMPSGWLGRHRSGTPRADRARPAAGTTTPAVTGRPPRGDRHRHDDAGGDPPVVPHDEVPPERPEPVQPAPQRVHQRTSIDRVGGGVLGKSQPRTPRSTAVYAGAVASTTAMTPSRAASEPGQRAPGWQQHAAVPRAA